MNPKSKDWGLGFGVKITTDRAMRFSQSQKLGTWI